MTRKSQNRFALTTIRSDDELDFRPKPAIKQYVSKTLFDTENVTLCHLVIALLIRALFKA